MHGALVTHITQFYTVQMTRCDNVFYLLYCSEERSCLQLTSVSSPIEMKILSEMIFLHVFLFEGWIYLSNWPKCQTTHLILKCLLFISQPCANSITCGTRYPTTSPSGMRSSASFPRTAKWASLLHTTQSPSAYSNLTGGKIWICFDQA